MNYKINTYIKSILIILLFTPYHALNAQTTVINLSGTWRFQTDLMDFRRGSLSPRYNHILPDKIELSGILKNNQQKAMKLSMTPVFN